MKKTIALSALVLSILAGLVSGSLALYQKEVTVGTGGVVAAKNFVLTAAGSTNFAADLDIAPTEEVVVAFTVSNNDGTNTTETGMDLDIKVTLAAASGKTAIPYITAQLLDSTDAVIATANSTVEDGIGDITLFVDHAFTASEAATKTYKIKLTWVSQGLTDSNTNGVSNDAEYQGELFGTAYTVKVTGTQDINL